MKYLGIDYGAKKIGLALSDGRGVVAFPHAVVINDDTLVSLLASMITEHGVKGIVVGDTKTESGLANEVTSALNSFVDSIKKRLDVEVFVVSEHGTSAAARAGLGENAPRGEISSPRSVSKDNDDARAAALILQRFLDTHQHTA